MENIEKWQESELIPLLIKYKNTIGEVFPISKVKHISNDILIERLKDCITKNKKYEVQINKLNEVQLLSDENLKLIFPLVLSTLEQINYDYESSIKEIMGIIELRNNGKTFTFSEHLKALIISLLSNHRWGDSNIRENIYKIDAIFHNYDKNYLKVADPIVLTSELKKIHCTNPMIKKQMESLAYNIEILEKIEKDFVSLDNFVSKNNPNDIANWLNEGKYQMKQVGRAFAFDYLKRIGVNTCKSSKQLERLFGANRLGIVKNEFATDGQTISIIKKISLFNSISELEVNSILQQFCLTKSANICGDQPKCEKCKLRKFCNYDK